MVFKELEPWLDCQCLVIPIQSERIIHKNIVPINSEFRHFFTSPPTALNWKCWIRKQLTFPRVLSHFSRVWLFATPWTVATGLLCPWDSLGKSTGVGWPRCRTCSSYISCIGRLTLPLAPPGKPNIPPGKEIQELREENIGLLSSYPLHLNANS